MSNSDPISEGETAFSNLDHDGVTPPSKASANASAATGPAGDPDNNSPNTGPAGVTVTSTLIPPERRRLSIPSRWISLRDNYHQVELDLRLLQAARILTSLRDLIAEKSFQFSHVIRVAPRKGVRTRARSAIAKINTQIGYHCRVYNLCRAAMVKLGADDGILKKFRVLERHDIASSGALLNPNEPGSTTQRLSWIWQCGRTVEDLSSLGLRECE